MSLGKSRNYDIFVKFVAIRMSPLTNTFRIFIEVMFIRLFRFIIA